MAITLSNFQKLVAGSKRRHQVLASVAAYVQGGETVAASQLGLQVVDGVSIIKGGLGKDVDYGGTGILFYDSGGTECATGVTFTAVLEVVGR